MPAPVRPAAAEGQPSLLGTAEAELLAEVAAIDPDALTPLEALQRLYELRGEARRRLAVEG